MKIGSIGLGPSIELVSKQLPIQTAYCGEKYCCCRHIRKGKFDIKGVDTDQVTTILNKIQGALSN